MAFCTNCGNALGAGDQFCANCGARQTIAQPPPASTSKHTDFLPGVSARTAAILCYVPVIGWIAAVIVLASERFRNDKTLRFHAFQGLCLFVVWLLVDWVLSPLLHALPHEGMAPLGMFAGLLHLVIFAAWIWMMIKTSQQEVFRLPILGDLADRLVAEQR